MVLKTNLDQISPSELDQASTIGLGSEKKEKLRLGNSFPLSELLTMAPSDIFRSYGGKATQIALFKEDDLVLFGNS